MKKKVLNIILNSILMILVLVFSLYVRNGFSKRPNVILSNYSVSDDETKLTFKTMVNSSIGYTRDFKDDDVEDESHYLTFYSTFGGLNSSFGAKNEFELELDENDTKIYFNRANGNYELVLYKDLETGEWLEPTK